MTDLAKIQQELKAPKGQFNSFGKYKYRNAEDIIEAAKPIIHKYGYHLILSDELVFLGDRYYVKATAILQNNDIEYISTAYAREEENKKGMDGSQITGASSSYARKYALNGLFAIDDTKDSDSTNKGEYEPKNEVSEDYKDYLLNLLESSSYDYNMRAKLGIKIKSLTSLEDYYKAKTNLEANQLGYDGVINPNQKDINSIIRKKVKHDTNN